MSETSLRLRSMSVLVGVVFLLVALAPRPAMGCSCMAPVDLGSMIDEAPAAFVGTMVDRQPGVDEFDAVFVFDVEEWVKSDLGDQVAIHSGSDSAMCGFETPTGERMGLLVYNDGATLTSGLCSMVSPDELIKVGSQHVAGLGAVPPLIAEDIGLPDGDSANQGSTTARVALGVILTAAVAGGVVYRMRKDGPVGYADPEKDG